MNNNKISVISKNVDDAQYAFYLGNNGDVEKKYYSESNIFTFSKKIENGLYTVSIFIKTETSTQIEKVTLVVDNGKLRYKEVIVDEKDYKVEFYNLESSVTFVVFNGFGSTKETVGFGVRYLLSQGFNVITCAQNNNQYQGLSFEDFKRIVGPLVKNVKVFLYGSSLGAYCAVYYAGAINGTVIAAAPKNSAHPKMKEYALMEFQEKDYKHISILGNRLTQMPVYIFIDPYVKSDVFFLNEFIKPAYPNCKVFEFPHAGHEVLYHINRLKKLSSLIMSIVRSEEIYISSSEYNQDTDFTRYGKALDAYRTAIKYINEIKATESVHPIISKRLQWLVKKIK